MITLITTLGILITHLSHGLQLHVWRVSDHDIKTATGEDVGERFFPTERFVAGDGGIVDEAVAALDVVRQIGEFSTSACGGKPQRKSGDFDRFFVDVDAVEVVLQNGGIDVTQNEGVAVNMGFIDVDQTVLMLQKLKRRI